MFNSRRSGMTRIELCVVVVVIVCLIGLLIPDGINGPHRSARRLQCMNNQRQIADAMAMYSTTHGIMPPSMSSPTDPATGKPARLPMSWVCNMFAELGRADLAELPYSTIANAKPNISLLVCPSDPSKYGTGGGLFSYVVNGGSFKHWHADASFDCLDRGAWELRVDGPNRSGPKKTLDFIAQHKGLAQTLSISENLDARSYIVSAPQADFEVTVLWDPSAPLGFNADVGGKLDNAHARPSSNHPGGTVVSFCDGHVAFVNNSIDYKVYATLMAVDPMLASSPDKPLPPSDPLASFLIWPLKPDMVPQ